MADDGGSHEGGGSGSGGGYWEQDRFLPIANISRLRVHILCHQRFETVSDVCGDGADAACRASDKCQKEKRKTINGDDLLWAMATLGFEEYVEHLKIYLQKYREGDSKLSTKAGEGSVKKDAISSHGGTSSSSNQ
ncbi:unnamed protein product [Miscanthus lutarioriparius]|uniref:Transcription factor CBF/NF-Y/archaeal histone domain-containing protein n=1 Tax=Miscanthus lutarioriparius TaxID=422564 RepID=A0A811RRV0_9POAL|nr:unnamed protein product [Miscanthus lutarioriparius]